MRVCRVVARSLFGEGGRGRIARITPLILVGLLPLATVSPAGVIVHSPDEVLAEWTVPSDDALLFHGPGGDVWELISEITDPAILNRGEGKFFPHQTELVHSALDALSYPTGNLDAEIFILPFPRRGLVTSNAGRATIYLSPGVAPLITQQVHAVVTHEFGHLVHNQLLDAAGWAEYRQVRGIENQTVYHDRAPHRNRPREIFAEDFRFLFGGALANYGGGIENPDLALPSRVPGLEDHMRSLAESPGPSSDGLRPPLRLHPNPTRDEVRMSFAEGEGPGAGEPVGLRVHDVQGRVLVQRELGSETGLRWDGRLDDGTAAPPGLYFIRVQSGARHWAGKLLILR
jgi:hypothetical protein